MILHSIKNLTALLSALVFLCAELSSRSGLSELPILAAVICGVTSFAYCFKSAHRYKKNKLLEDINIDTQALFLQILEFASIFTITFSTGFLTYAILKILL